MFVRPALCLTVVLLVFSRAYASAWLDIAPYSLQPTVHFTNLAATEWTGAPDFGVRTEIIPVTAQGEIITPMIPLVYRSAIPASLKPGQSRTFNRGIPLSYFIPKESKDAAYFLVRDRIIQDDFFRKLEVARVEYILTPQGLRRLKSDRSPTRESMALPMRIHPKYQSLVEVSYSVRLRNSGKTLAELRKIQEKLVGK